jgi:predicted TIM-barrel fold metal-dependent hydrolase
MIIVDTHAHASPYWLEPVEVLLSQMNSNGVDKTTLVAIEGQMNEKYNRYLVECTHRFPGRFSPVVLVDTERADAPKLLKYWAKEGAEGVRLKTYTRSPGKDPWAIWKACADLGLRVSCQGHKQADFVDGEFQSLLKALPDLTVIIEHLGKAKVDEAAPYPLYQETLPWPSSPMFTSRWVDWARFARDLFLSMILSMRLKVYLPLLKWLMRLLGLHV